MSWLGRSRIPALYAILDGEAVLRAGMDLMEVARAFRAAEVPLLQYRDKRATPTQVIERARAISAIFGGTDTVLILNDWPEGSVELNWHGVHVGQTDGSVQHARQIVGADRLIGVSTHIPAQVSAAQQTDADYVAVGPVYGTASKAAAEPVIGLSGVKAARQLTTKPIVAIGGITTRERVRETLTAGADALAVISALLPPDGSVAEKTREMLLLCGSVRRASDHGQPV